MRLVRGRRLHALPCPMSQRGDRPVGRLTGPTLLINEVLADPPMDLAGDANGDGTRSFWEDEFVELVNVSAEAVDLSGYTISERASTRRSDATTAT